MNREQMINDLILRGWECFRTTMAFRGLRRGEQIILGLGTPISTTSEYKSALPFMAEFGAWGLFADAELKLLHAKALAYDA